jgi:predicted DNA binding CopG/RHH family protein
MKRKRFKNEEEEREFWAHQDSTKLLDWSKGKRVTLPNLRPSTKTISLRLPEGMLDDLKQLANERDVPYQSLIKVFLLERIRRETKKAAA